MRILSHVRKPVSRGPEKREREVEDSQRRGGGSLQPWPTLETANTFCKPAHVGIAVA